MAVNNKKERESRGPGVAFGEVGQAWLLFRVAAQEFGGEEGDRKFVVAGDGEAAPRAAARGASDDVCEWAVGLYEVEVGGREVFERMAEVAHERHALEEDFRQHDRRAYVEVDTAAVHAPHKLCEQAEVRVRRR